MKLLIQPGDDGTALIKGINLAKRTVDIAIFRFDHREIEKALAHAVGRGVTVRALIAHTNRTGEENLRKLELRLLAAGVTVARTADDLLRYHGKFMIADQREVYVLAFNLTYLDIERCRSFGVVMRSPSVAREALRVFDADSKRTPYEPGSNALVVSPTNARRQLSAFIQGARKELLIYDPKVSDPAMIRLLEERARAGVSVQIIGKLTRASSLVEVRKLAPLRLHTRTIIRDGRMAFVGSQSLRSAELDMRREIGIIIRDAKAVRQLAQTFRGDWLAIEQNAETAKTAPAEKLAKKVAKAVVKELPPVAPVLDTVVKEFAAHAGALELDPEDMQETVNEAVKQAVREAVKDAVEEAVEHSSAGAVK